jgi:hypothetical protein
VIVQVPAFSMVTVVPETVQTLPVELAKVTVVPAESEAVPNEKVPAPPATQVWDPGEDQVMVWVAPIIVILTGVPGVLA